MSNKGNSVAPKERINIKYVPATGDGAEETELPLKLLVVGDFLGKDVDENIESRDLASINKNNFNAVMEESNLNTSFEVNNKLIDEASEDDTIHVDLKFNKIEDFNPDNVAAQVPEVKKLVDLREALVALKGPLGNLPQFRKGLQELIDNEEGREELLKELGATDNISSDK